MKQENDDGIGLIPELIKTEIKEETYEALLKSEFFVCPRPNCKMQFITEEPFIEHVQRHHLSSSGGRNQSVLENDNLDDIPDDETICKTTYYEESHSVQNRLTHEETLYKHSPFSYSILDASQQAPSNEKPLKFPQCKSHLLRPQKTRYARKKPHKCSQCSYFAASKSNLIQHAKIHSSEKPYKCPDCSYCAKRKSHLIVHQRAHTGEKPYKCSRCSYSATRKDSLYRHQQTHTVPCVILNSYSVI